MVNAPNLTSRDRKLVKKNKLHGFVITLMVSKIEYLREENV